MAIDPRRLAEIQAAMQMGPQNPAPGATANPNPMMGGGFGMGGGGMTPGAQDMSMYGVDPTLGDVGGGMQGFATPQPPGGMMQGGFGMGGGGGFDPMAMQGEQDPLAGLGGGDPLAGLNGLPQAGGLDIGMGPQEFAPQLDGLAEDNMMIPTFAREKYPRVYDPDTRQNRLVRPKNYSLLPQKKERYGIDETTGVEYGAGPSNKYWKEGEQIPTSISGFFMGR